MTKFAPSNGNRPLAIDLYCGLGGWSEALIAEGYYVVGFDIERHQYGEHRYPGQLVIQDVTTLHGSQFKDAALIVASPPCQEYSYMAMPWKLAKAKAAVIRADATGAALERLNRLFNACFRIQREACEAACRRIPLVIENVRGAIPWVGRSRWNFGSFHLWGDVLALMPITFKGRKVPSFRFDGSGRSFQSASVEHAGIKAPGMNWSDQTKRGQDFTRLAGNEAIKNSGGSWFNIDSPGQKVVGQNPDGRLLHIRDGHGHTRHLTNADEHSGTECPLCRGSGAVLPNFAANFTVPCDRCMGTGRIKPAEGRKGAGAEWFDQNLCSLPSKSSRRKAASALIAKIPAPLARHIAATFKPPTQIDSIHLEAAE